MCNFVLNLKTEQTPTVIICKGYATCLTLVINTQCRQLHSFQTSDEDESLTRESTCKPKSQLCTIPSTILFNSVGLGLLAVYRKVDTNKLKL